MAIMAMATAKIINKNAVKLSSVTAGAALALLMASPLTLAGDWKFTPSLVLDETYTDNVELTIAEPNSSLVTQSITSLNADYKSRVANLTFAGTKSYTIYSHDSSLNDDHRSLNADGQYSLWTGGPTITADARIANISKNNAVNSLADLVSGDTVETQNYSTGLQYNFGNSSYSITSSVNYDIRRAEDNIGESNGLNAKLSSENGSNARYVYWQFDANHSKRKQELDNNVNNNGNNYTIEALIGAITRFNFNPFFRYYDEDVSGTGVSQNEQSTSSFGPGLRWLASPHVIIDLSYNFVADETVSDDYIAASIKWEPSARTSLIAGYSQRFFGDTYNLDFSHKTKRLTNSISYTETLSVFDRNNYEEVNSGSIELIESNQYSLNKRFSWSSKLQLSRTSFTFGASSNKRENIETEVIDDQLTANLTVTRATSAKGNLSLSVKYNYSIYDKGNFEKGRQEDHYNTISAAYYRSLASSLSTNFTVQHVNRNSTNEQYSYDEVRAVINIKKEF